MDSEKIKILGEEANGINAKIDDRLNAIYNIEQKINMGAILTGSLFILISLI